MVDLEKLRQDEIIPLTWFFQEQQEPLLDTLQDEEWAQQVVNEIRQNLWQRLYDELPFQLYLSGEIEYRFAPNVQQLALLDQLLGRLENPVRVFSEKQLERRDAAIAEEKGDRIRINRRRLRIAFVLISFLLGFIASDAIIAHPPPDSLLTAQRSVQGIAVVVIMILEWQLEGIFYDYGLTEKYELVGDFVETVEERVWTARVLRAVFGLFCSMIVVYEWTSIQAFFQSF